MSHFLDQLAGGDRRSIGKSDAVAPQVLTDASRFAEIMAGLWAGDRAVRMRCADVAEKVARKRPEWLQPHKRELLRLAAQAKEPELRWHLAQMLPRLVLTPGDLGGRSILAAPAKICGRCSGAMPTPVS